MAGWEVGQNDRKLSQQQQQQHLLLHELSVAALGVEGEEADSEVEQEVDLEDAVDMEAIAGFQIAEVAMAVTAKVVVSAAATVVAFRVVTLMAGTEVGPGAVVFEPKKKAAAVAAVSGASHPYCFSLQGTDSPRPGVVAASVIQVVGSMTAHPMDLVLDQVDRVGQAHLLPREVGWRVVDMGIVGTSNVKVPAVLMTGKLNDRVIDLQISAKVLYFSSFLLVASSSSRMLPALDGMNPFPM